MKTENKTIEEQLKELQAVNAALLASIKTNACGFGFIVETPHGEALRGGLDVCKAFRKGLLAARSDARALIRTDTEPSIVIVPENDTAATDSSTVITLFQGWPTAFVDVHLAVNEVFVYTPSVKELVVRPGRSGSCVGCALKAEDCIEQEGKTRPHCLAERRRDGIDVIFVEKRP